jgi:hypothetical protein
MSLRRFGVLVAFAIGLGLVVGIAQAGAAGPTQVLKLHGGQMTQTAVGFNINSNATPPLGSQYIITVVLSNAAAQFGKPIGARVGRALIDCTFLSANTSNGDGICSGIAHLPDGYITFGGNGGFSNARYQHWAITGGVGPYATDRGELRTGGGTAIVTLYS